MTGSTLPLPLYLKTVWPDVMNPFLNACGLKRPLQIEVDNRINRRVVIRALDQPFAVVGRDSNCDVALSDKQVSRRHVYLQVIGGRLFWIDLDSQLGTYVDGQSWKSGWLGGGRLITVGPCDVRSADVLEDSSAPGNSESLYGSPLIWRSYGNQEPTDATVEFLNGPTESKIWPIRRVLSLIGTARRCKFRLADRSVEPFHCSLLRTHRGLFVVDLLGGDGIKINDHPARWSRLHDGDLLQVGRYRIRIRCQSSDDAESNRGVLSKTDLGATYQSMSAGLPATLPTSQPVELSTAPRIEVVAYEAETVRPAELERLPASLGRNELAESLLIPLVSQFGEMQQQMFDQFQQTMGMMAQMFGKMHENQMDQVRREFEQLADLTKEINDLKSELADLAKRQAAPASGPLDSKPAPRPAPTIAGEAQRKEAAAQVSQIAASSRVESEAKPAAPPADAGQDDRDVIVWLHQRITSIQNEREGRWQKILKLIPVT